MRNVLFVAAMLLCVFLTQRTRAAALPECPAEQITKSCVLTHDHPEALTGSGLRRHPRQFLESSPLAMCCRRSRM